MIVDGYEMTASHSEADIYMGCIALMQELMGSFEEYLDFIGLDPKDANDEERFATYFYPTHIVERLFPLEHAPQRRNVTAFEMPGSGG